MLRIPVLTEGDMNEAQRRVYAKIAGGTRKGPPIGPLVAAMHRPELAEAWAAMGDVLRFHSSLPERLREFVILLTGRFWDSQFEWYAHEPIALRAGLTQQTVDTLRQGGAQFADAGEQLLHDYATTLLARHFVDDALYERARAHFGTSVLIEITALVGYYCMVSLTLNAHGFDVPPGTPRPLPQPAGKAP